MHIYLSEIREKQESLIHKLRQDSLAANHLAEQPVEAESSKYGDGGAPSQSSVSAKSLKDKRKLVEPKGVVRQSQKPPPATNNESDELAALKAELEREKAEKARLAEEMANQKSAAAAAVAAAE